MRLKTPHVNRYWDSEFSGIGIKIGIGIDIDIGSLKQHLPAPPSVTAWCDHDAGILAGGIWKYSCTAYGCQVKR